MDVRGAFRRIWHIEVITCMEEFTSAPYRKCQFIHKINWSVMCRRISNTWICTYQMQINLIYLNMYNIHTGADRGGAAVSPPPLGRRGVRWKAAIFNPIFKIFSILPPLFKSSVRACIHKYQTLASLIYTNPPLSLRYFLWTRARALSD